MMDSPPKLSGETLIVHHIPLVHCQVSGRRRGGSNSSVGSLKRSNPFSPPENLGLSRTTSLPERDVLQREALLYSSLIHTSSGSSETGGGEEGKRTINASDDSSVTSSISEDQLFTANTLPRAKAGNRNPLRRNPFLLNTGDEEYEEEDADDLSGYLEDSSFQLHSDTSSALEDVVAPFHLHDFDFATEPFLLHSSVKRSSHDSLRGGVSDLSAHLKDLDLMGLDRQCRHGSSGSNMSMDCGEQDWGDDDDYEDHPMRCGRSSKTGSYSSTSSLSQTCMHHFPETFGDPFHHGYASDSSCNSSDGVLVNFSAIFNRMNNSVPEKQQPSALINLNGSSDQSCTSPVSCDPTGNHQDLGGGAFYLDLQTSPTEPPRQQQQMSSQGSGLSLIREPHLSTSSTCSCSVEHQGALALDANCNSYHPPQSGSSGDLASCLQSQARLVVATQNYYKLVSCDLSSQSSPSPAPSSVNSCSDEHSKGSPTPSQPSEYFLFRRQDGVDEEREDGPSFLGAKGDNDGQKEEEEDEEGGEEEKEKKKKSAEGGAGTSPSVIKGQVYVNTSPPLIGRDVIGGGGVSSVGRLRSRSYDRNLDKSPSPRLGSLERMLSCPVRLSEGAAPAPTPPPRVTSFAEIARSKRRNGGVGASPPLKTNAEPFYYAHSSHSHTSGEFSPIQEQRLETDARCLGPAAFSRCYSSGSMERSPEMGRESCRRPEGIESASDSPPAVIRYSRDQRPTSLPIQPFTFHHQFPSKQAQPKPLLPLLSGYVSGMQARGGSESTAGGAVDEDSENMAENKDRYQEAPTGEADPGPGSVRPSPLGSYSPVRLQGAQSSGTCSTCTPSPQPPAPPPPAQRPQNLSSPLSAGTSLSQGKQEVRSVPLLPTPPLSLSMKRGAAPTLLPPLQGHCYHRGVSPVLSGLQSDTLSPLGIMESGKPGDGGKGGGARIQNAHHLSPQALKWKEYRRRNPLGVERVCEPRQAATGQRTVRRNVFDFPSAPSSYTLGRHQRSQSAKPLQSDFLSDYFSLTEKPPEEFCLSPDASSSTSSSSHVFVDLIQKRALVKAVNTAVDLIVAHFGTSRDPDIKAKLGNSWVSPNIGHLILKYLCPALHDVLQDGLKPYVLDLIIGQRRCQPWSLVEASTQLGPSTRVLHSLFSKVSQFPELNNTNMRINAFIFGLLNLKSLEFWFTHLHTHEDIIDAHYNPWGFLPLARGPCRPLFQELLLLLQPLSLLPFDLDLLFEPHLLQKGAEHLRRKELLCSAGGQRVTSSDRSTFELMRGWSATVSDMVRDSAGEAKAERAGLRREGTWPSMEVKRRNGAGLDGKRERRETGVGQEDRRSRRQEEESEHGRHRQERQAGWWYQLMQSSQVYIDQSSERNKFLKVDKRKKSAMERRHAQAPPTREGVVEGAESQPEVEGYKNSSVRGRPTWMGSPPESVLSPSSPPPAGQEQSQNLRWSRLFGSRGEGTQPRGRSQKTRPPSGWFSLDRSVLDLVAQTIGAGSGKKLDPPTAVTHTTTTTTTSPPSNTKQPSLCEVRALCDHVATERGQLSFNKGDVLRVHSRADPDWLLCSLNSNQGIVPIIYVTLKSSEGEEEEEQEEEQAEVE